MRKNNRAGFKDISSPIREDLSAHSISRVPSRRVGSNVLLAEPFASKSCRFSPVFNLTLTALPSAKLSIVI